MKDKRYTIPTFFYLIIFGLLIIGLIIGSFLDADVSHALYNQNSGLGKFVETFGSFLGYAMIMVGGTTLFCGLFFRNNRIMRIAACIVLTAAFGLAVYFFADQIGTFGKDPKYYGFRITNTAVAFIVSVVMMAGIGAATFFLIDKTKEDDALKIGLIIVAAVFLQWLILHFLKKMGGRPRYRFLLDPEWNDGTHYDIIYEFKNWYQFAFGKSPSNDFFKSWPSGHSGVAASVLAMGYFPNAMKKRFRFDNYIFFGVAFVYLVIVMIARILIGAHFLSDVTTGGMIGAIVVFLPSFAIERLKFFNRKQEEKEPEPKVGETEKEETEPKAEEEPEPKAEEPEPKVEEPEPKAEEPEAEKPE